MFDAHVHAGPDVVHRRTDDIGTVTAYRRAGFTGCVLKSHYESTVGRAHAAAQQSGLAVYGGIVLNAPAGGINPSAVAAALLAGGRVVWMPTEDARAHAERGLHRLVDHERRAAAASIAIPPLDWSTAGDIDLILQMVADADAVLATGHVGHAELSWLVPRALAAGVRRLLLTHPTYTVPALRPAEVAELCALGAHVEVTAYQLSSQPGCQAADLAHLVRTVGFDRLVLSSDAGQPENPEPPEALESLVETLAGEGLDRAGLIAAASDVPARLITP